MDVVDHADSREELILRHMPLVRRVASSVYSVRRFDGVPFDDYVQLGAEGLIRAADAYDEDLGAAFETYAGHRIRGNILSGLEKATEINQQVTTFKRLARERMASLSQQEAAGLEDVDDAADGQTTRTPEQAFARLIDVSISLAIAFMLEDTALFMDAEAPHWDDGQANLSFKQLQRRLVEALKALTEAERKVIEQHYFEHGDFASIAEGMALSRGRISQIHRTALGRLRTLLQVGSSCELLG